MKGAAVRLSGRNGACYTPAMRKTLLLSLLAVLVPALALAQDDTPAKLDALYAKRDDPAAQKELEQALQDAFKASPDDYGVLWRVARSRYWAADGLPNGDSKKKLGKEAWDLAERALKKNPKGTEASYYAAVSIGAYSQAVGILAALAEGLEGKFNDRLDYAIKVDGGYDHGGPLIAKGRYFFELPWPKRDLGKANQILQKVTEAHPEALRAYVYLAEAQLDDGKAALARETLAKAVSGAVSYDPAEGKRAKEMARKVQADKKELR